MSKTYEKINYRVRPAKSIERKMLCDSFRLLNEFENIGNYRYIGFGSTYFSDFYLFHKQLNINNMISIEQNDTENDKKRFEFNRPFSCVTIKFGIAGDILPTLKWDNNRTILWLDYDSPLSLPVLTDISHFISSAITGSVIIITVKANIRNKQKKEKEIDTLKDLLECDDKIPFEITNEDFRGRWGTANIFRKIIINEIEDILTSRNGVHSSEDKLIFKQLYNFNYADGTEMLTVGGILFDEGSKQNFDNCDFDSLEFIKGSDEPYKINVPKLTIREIKYLEQLLPNELNTKAPFIPSKDRDNYSKLYRYFPVYTESEL